MARRMVVCCDGTWNRPQTQTNVYRTFSFLAAQIVGDRRDEPVPKDSGSQIVRGHTADGTELVLFYDQGVGTGLGELLRGGALGVGLSKNVCDAYDFLSNFYALDSEIYIFGFSRGAFTARSLCGFIGAVGGLLRHANLDEVARAYLKYYVKSSNTEIADILNVGESKTDRLLNGLGRVIGGLAGKQPAAHEPIDEMRRTPVALRFVGVYDTVGALGVPLPQLAVVSEPVVHFHDQTLSPTVEHTVQALAVDEQRGPYNPTIWALSDAAQALAPTQSCLQVWFPGVHSDIGGGYDDDRGIGDVTWHFMMQQAADRGLAEARSAPAPAAADLPPQHDSYDSFWKAMSSRFEKPEHRLRAVGNAARKTCGDDPCLAAGEEMLHPSLVARRGRPVVVIGKDGPSAPAPYRPRNLEGVELPVFGG